MQDPKLSRDFDGDLNGQLGVGAVHHITSHFGGAAAIIKRRERIKRQTIQHRRLQHRKLAA